jgi:5-methyltetrahydrofolate--homocysteine methyltransferase
MEAVPVSGLLYREDMDEVRERLTLWWNGGDIGRPVLRLTAPRSEPVAVVPVMPEPEGWLTHYSTQNFDYRVNLAARACINKHYLAEEVPSVSPDLAPNCLALYLGCKGVEMPSDTVWCEPCFERPEEARFEFDPNSFYWDFTLRLGKEMLRLGKGKFLVEFPDFIEGLDTLGAMRGSERLLTDLIDSPEWVQRCVRQIIDRHFHYYDILYDLFRDEVGGSMFWAWAPGRMVKLQCDFSAMISPGMFGEFMVPVLKEMSERTSYSMYHWDGPGALPHHDHLLSIPNLNMLQWTPGAGNPPPDHQQWWPYYHKSIDAGKKLFVHSCEGVDSLKAMKREFGERLNQFLIVYEAPTLAQAQVFLDTAQT